ncbi:MAG TPA: hypothetical protein VI277_09860 [Candidatus Limnocylindria bacterium]
MTVGRDVQPDGIPGPPVIATESADAPPSPGRVQRQLDAAATQEAVTMALYVGISLLAVLVGIPTSSLTEPIRLVLFTSLGLLLAHVIAFRLSARLMHHGLLVGEHVRLLGAQIAGGLAVTALAVAPVLLLPDEIGLPVSELALLGLVAGTGYVAARMIPLSRTRAVLSVLGLVAATLAVLWIKALVGH